MITEFERRTGMWLVAMTMCMLPFTQWLWWHTMMHLYAKAPCPQLPLYGCIDNRKQDYTWAAMDYTQASQCKDCRWLEYECKKICYDKLRDLGYQIWGLDR